MWTPQNNLMATTGWWRRMLTVGLGHRVERLVAWERSSRSERGKQSETGERRGSAWAGILITTKERSRVEQGKRAARDHEESSKMMRPWICEAQSQVADSPGKGTPRYEQRSTKDETTLTDSPCNQTVIYKPRR